MADNVHAVAGRTLFAEGAVRELEVGGDRGAGEEAASSSCLAHRVFEVRGPKGGPPDVVVLKQTPDRQTCTAECSCRLRGNCKHVAAAMCAVERELKKCDGKPEMA